jgi:hypothetical protein
VISARSPRDLDDISARSPQAKLASLGLTSLVETHVRRETN